MDSPATVSSTKIDIYQVVTDRIVELLAQGTIPWQKPWKDGGPPRNLLSNRSYRGINYWLLMSLNYEHSLYLTWEQVKAAGASVVKGEKSHMIVFWRNVRKKPEEIDDKGNPKTIPMLRYYRVYNIAQCKDIPENLLPKEPLSDMNPLVQCQAILNEAPNLPTIQHKGILACYQIDKDRILMPPFNKFETPEGYYCTLFHELIHATGHEKRLNRDSVMKKGQFGDEKYSFEELIAEMGSAYLCNHTGILPQTVTNTSAYIDEWLQVLQNDKKFVFQAAGLAQKAADYILNFTYGTETTDEE